MESEAGKVDAETASNDYRTPESSPSPSTAPDSESLVRLKDFNAQMERDIEALLSVEEDSEVNNDRLIESRRSIDDDDDDDDDDFQDADTSILNSYLANIESNFNNLLSNGVDTDLKHVFPLSTANQDITAEKLKKNLGYESGDSDDEGCEHGIENDERSPVSPGEVATLRRESIGSSHQPSSTGKKVGSTAHLEKYRRTTNKTKPSLVLKAAASGAASASPNTQIRSHNQQILDERLQGDYSAWMTGPRLTSAGLRSVYSGLSPCNLDKEAWRSDLLVECVLRPDVSCQKIMDTMTKVVRSSRAEQHTKGTENLRFVVCDEYHVTVHLNALKYVPDEGSEDFDVIDIQTCISRELRQRVLLCQLLKRRRKTVACAAKRSEIYGSILARVMQRSLTMNQLSFSCLYMADVKNVLSLSGPEGICPQFALQLESWAKEKMIIDLKDFFDDLEEQTQHVVNDTDMFKMLLVPIFKQHGVAELPGMDSEEINMFEDEDYSKSKTREENEEDGFLLLDNADGPVMSFRNEGKTWCGDYLENQIREGEDVINQCEASLLGLTKVVVALDKINTYFGKRSEQRIRDIQSRKSKDATLTLNACCTYRKKLVRFLINSLAAQSSSLTKVFIDSFKAVGVFDKDAYKPNVLETSDVPPCPTVDANEAESSSSSLSSYFVNLKPLAEHINKNTTKFIPGFNGDTSDVAQSSKVQPVDDSQTNSVKKGQDDTRANDTKTNLSPAGKILEWIGMPLESIKEKNTEVVSHEVFASALPRLVVLSYAACFIGATPATMYITPSYVAISSGIPGFAFSNREIYPISQLSNVTVTANTPTSNLPTSGIIADLKSLPKSIQPCQLILHFGFCDRTIHITPAVIDARSLRILLIELKSMDSSPYEYILKPNEITDVEES